MQRFLKPVLIVLLLAIFFVFDDILIFFLIDDVFAINLQTLWVTVILTALFLVNLLFAWLVYRVLRKRPVTGKEGMIGKKGIVLSATGEGNLKVQIEGEIWQASCLEKLHSGEKIKVTAIDGLRLSVEKCISSE